MLREYLIEDFSCLDDMIGRDFYIGRLSFHPAKRLMDHDLCMRERIAFSLRTTTENDRSHRGCKTDRHGDDIWFYRLHGIIDSETRSHMSSRRVHIESNWCFRIDLFEIEKLRDYCISDGTIDRISEKYNTVFEKSRIDIIGTLLSSDFIDDGRYKEIRDDTFRFGIFQIFSHKNDDKEESCTSICEKNKNSK